MSCSFNFSDKKVLVTGASQGLGYEICKSLSNLNAKVFALARNREKLEALAKEHTNIVPIVGDVTETKEELEKILAEHQPFDFLINNAAIAHMESALEATVKNLDEMYQVNVRGPIIIAEIVAKEMIAHEIKGSIVNVSSQSGLRPLHDRIGYSSSKAALDMVTRVQAREWGIHGIRVNSVNPTVIILEQGLGVWSDSDKAKWMRDQLPLKKFAAGKDVINAILFLLSDASALTTGLAFPVDGGYSSQ
ncbi:unnamed protein product, partial [Mesorhabditis belari]|uniref:L-xylulose reductase n=1 Tax=Mesorhabditis belari TaxID=2138241 RepID=A0AAF3FHK7_9BILA